ncbi:MAG: hypothetical protein ABSC05_02610 [Candidatus Solibacter sp.]|jgi:hypothetical protein
MRLPQSSFQIANRRLGHPTHIDDCVLGEPGTLAQDLQLLPGDVRDRRNVIHKPQLYINILESQWNFTFDPNNVLVNRLWLIAVVVVCRGPAEPQKVMLDGAPVMVLAYWLFALGAGSLHVFPFW